MTKGDKDEYQGAEAQEILQTFVQISLDSENWEAEYRDPETGDIWLQDYLYPEAHGGGFPRIRKIIRGSGKTAGPS